MTPRPRSFRYEERGAVAVLTLDRPERLNALTFEVYAELRDTFAQLGRISDVRAVVLTGAGRGFCSGGDVEDIIGALFGRDLDGLREFTTMTCDVIRNLRRMEKPVIAAVNGVAAGAGAVIAAACDFRIASEAARIAFLFPKVGLSGADMGASWLLPRLIGLGAATELLMTGEFVDAPRALELGLYHRVVPQDQVLPRALALAEKLAQGPGAALAATKRALDDEADLDLESALQYEARVQAGLMQHPDYREAYEAFRAKREPRFR